MKYLPVFLDMTITPCLVVGGGVVAARKVEQLLRSNAQVTVLAPELCSELSKFVDEQLIEYVSANFSEEYLQN